MQLDQGLIDFGLIFAPIDHTRYHVLDVPEKDIWGCLMRSDHPLAAKPSVTPEDLKTQPLIISRQARDSDTLSEWFGIPLSSLHIAATYSLVYNATLMVEDGIGCALCLDGIINSAGSGLVFRPLSPSQTASMSIIWKKNQIFSGASDCFLSALQESLTER